MSQVMPRVYNEQLLAAVWHDVNLGLVFPGVRTEQRAHLDPGTRNYRRH